MLITNSNSDDFIDAEYQYLEYYNNSINSNTLKSITYL
jgi:hypothetical protein